MNAVKGCFTDKGFLKTFVMLSVPIAMQNLLTTGVNLLDNVMIGKLGEAAIASVSLANQVFFVLSLILFGVCSGCSVFISQFHGKGDEDSIRKMVAVNMIAGVLVSGVFTAAAILFPHALMRIFSPDDAEVVELGVGYLRIIAFSYAPMAISFAFSFALKSTARPKIPLVLAAVSLVCNGTLNYILIFGAFGISAMGVRGAALATTITRVVELALTLLIVYIRIPALAVRLGDVLAVTREFIVRFFRTAIPVILNETMWGLGVCMYSVVYGRMGTDVVAAVNIAATVERLLNIFMIGMGNATAVMIGREMGRSNFALAKEYAARFSALSIILGALIGVALVGISPVALKLFDVSGEVVHMAYQILFVIAVIMILRNYNHTHIVGTLRSGGDTRFCLLLDGVVVWAISLPLVWMAGLWWRLPIGVVYTMFFAEETVKIFLIHHRLKKGNWVNNLVENL
ncbi:MAG: MATE family efflux transporter [Ruminococcaceae bacterium]|nr:MATE family efflux transporter [Oscillospiraceae bacterium]